MKAPDRLTVVHTVLLLFAAAIIGKAAKEQLWHHTEWARQGVQQHYEASELPAPRGDILDESGNVLVESRELVQIRIAPKEVRNRKTLLRLMRAAKVDDKYVKQVAEAKRAWIEVQPLFLPNDVASITAMVGVHPKAILERVYANSAGIRRIVGRLDPKTGAPMDGIELALDDILRGDTGRVRVARDKSGKQMQAPGDVDPPQPGRNVTLTINRNLQDICEHALGDAVDSLRASGGDIVVMNPHTGEILALASRRADPAAIANTAVTEPYEPGSTLKPFMAAALMDRGLAKPTEVIQTYNGEFELEGRVIHDEHKAAALSLADVIKFSSNIGIVRFSSRLTPRQKYEVLRDAGFGTATTVTLPGESSGLLRNPINWSKQSAASVAMGYELGVTPLQLATAYSAIANGGELLEPQIVKQVSKADGTVVYKGARRVVRRIMSESSALAVQKMLREVVEGGTSVKADLRTIDVAGKSGTARRAVKGKYVQGAYTASFVGFFPADRPQYVVLAKLDNPQTTIYGGTAAGGVTNVVLRAAMAASNASLDLHQLAASVHAPTPDTSAEGRREVRAKRISDSLRVIADSQAKKIPVAVAADTDPRTSASYVVTLPSVRRLAPVVATVRPVPDVTGLPLRAAARTLHAAGFRVQLVGGAAGTTDPVAGTPYMLGRVVKLSGGQ